MGAASHSAPENIGIVEPSKSQPSSSGIQRVALLIVCLASMTGWLYLLWRAAAILIATPL
jgi:hypothetical protein